MNGVITVFYFGRFCKIIFWNWNWNFQISKHKWLLWINANLDVKGVRTQILFETHMWCLICLKHCMVSFPHFLVFYSFPCLLITFLLYYCIYLTLKNIHLFVSHFTNLYREVLVSVNWYGIPNSLALAESTVIFHLLVNTPW